MLKGKERVPHVSLILRDMGTADGRAPESQVSQLRRDLGHPCFTISQENRAVEMFIRHRLPESSSSILQSCLRIFTELTAPETCTFSPLVVITDSLF